MDKMVISFNPSGSVEHLLKDGFIKLEGERHITRLSEIPHDDVRQQFYIRWLQGPYEGIAHTDKMAYEYLRFDDERIEHLVRPMSEGLLEFGEPAFDGHRPIWFTSYEAAVEHEIVMVNAMRLKGVSFNG